MTLRSGGGWLVVPFLSVWVVLWTIGTLSFDVMASLATWKQARTQWFHTTPGTILHSKVEEIHDDGTTYHVKVRYAYEVNGQRYESEQFRYAQTSGSRRWTYGMVAAMPREQTVTVYYDPQQPAESVLMPGVAMCDVLMSVFLLPFNLVMLAAWAGIFYAVRSGFVPPADLPTSTQLLAGPHGQVVRFPATSPVAAGGCASGIVAFVLMFFLGFICELHGPIWPAFFAWVLIIAAGVLAARWAIRDQASGQYDLVINDSRRVIALPKRRDDFESPAWEAFADLRQTAVDNRTTKDSDGDDVKQYVTQLVTRDSRRLDVSTWSNEEDARKVAEWLARRLRLEAPAKG